MVFKWVNDQVLVRYVLNYGKPEDTETKVQN